MTAIQAFGRERFLPGVGELAARGWGESEAEEERLVPVQVRARGTHLLPDTYLIRITSYYHYLLPGIYHHYYRGPSKNGLR